MENYIGSESRHQKAKGMHTEGKWSAMSECKGALVQTGQKRLPSCSFLSIVQTDDPTANHHPLIIQVSDTYTIVANSIITLHMLQHSWRQAETIALHYCLCTVMVHLLLLPPSLCLFLPTFLPHLSPSPCLLVCLSVCLSVSLPVGTSVNFRTIGSQLFALYREVSLNQMGRTRICVEAGSVLSSGCPLNRGVAEDTVHYHRHHIVQP